MRVNSQKLGSVGYVGLSLGIIPILVLSLLLPSVLYAASELWVPFKSKLPAICDWELLRSGVGIAKVTKEEQQLLKSIELIATPGISSQKKIAAFKKIQETKNPRSYVAVASAYSELMKHYKTLASEGGENDRSNLAFMNTDLPGLTFFYYHTLDTLLERLSALERDETGGFDPELRRAIETYSRVSFFLTRLREHDHLERGRVISQITGEDFSDPLLEHFYSYVKGADFNSKDKYLENSQRFSRLFEGLSFLETHHQLSMPPLLTPYRHFGNYVSGVLRSGATMATHFLKSFLMEYLLLLERSEDRESKKAAIHLSQLLVVRDGIEFEDKLARIKLSGSEDPFIKDAVSRLRIQGVPTGENEIGDSNFRLNLILFHLNYFEQMRPLAWGLESEISLVDF